VATIYSETLFNLLKEKLDVDKGKAEKFERHRKELRKKAFLNATIIILAATGLAFYIGGYAAEFLFLLTSSGMAVFFSTVFVGVLIAIWSVPFLHYKETDTFRSGKGREFYLGRDLEDLPLVKILEDRGWEKIKSDGKEITLKTYPTLFHRLIKSYRHLTLEQVEEDENQEITVMRKDDTEVARIKTEYEDTEEGLKIKETTVSRSRVSPIYLEVTMFLTPEFEELTEEATEEDIEVIDEEIDFRLKQYEFQ
jgi:hypothetical protein